MDTDCSTVENEFRSCRPSGLPLRAGLKPCSYARSKQTNMDWPQMDTDKHRLVGAGGWDSVSICVNLWLKD
jgi:hypothetical protein